MNKTLQNIRIDLHTHTLYSDGIYTPKQLVNLAVKHNISKLSITDHDNISALDEAANYTSQFDIELINGVELSSEYNGVEIHILAYFFDHRNSQLLDYLLDMRNKRMERAEIMVDKLKGLGFDIHIDDVIDSATPERSIARPHIANTLLNKGLIPNYYEAFNKYLTINKPAYVKKPSFNVKETLELISFAGGMSFLAHPGRYVPDADLLELAQMGFDGIEVIHPSHTPNDIKKLRAVTAGYFLLESGGSDFHGSKVDEENFGKYLLNVNKFNEIRSHMKYSYEQRTQI